MTYQDYEPINGKCSLIDERAANPVGLVGCLKKLDGTCVNCANGFRRKDGKCFKGVEECMEYDSNG